MEEIKIGKDCKISALSSETMCFWLFLNSKRYFDSQVIATIYSDANVHLKIYIWHSS